MKEKTIITSIVISVFLIGIVSAAILPFFGKISGSVSVSAPVFYLDGSVIPISPHTLDLVYRNLTIDIPPTNDSISYIFDGHKLLFITKPLNINHFYNATFNIKIWVKTNNLGNILQFRIVKVSPSLIEKTICSPDPINITKWYNQYRERDTNCSSSGPITFNLGDRMGLEIYGAGGTSEYWIKTGHSYTHGYSRIEVIPQ